MVNAALEARWSCAFANDIDPMKCDVYRQNWGEAHLAEGDIAALDPAQMQVPLDLVWASSPCQDFSLAGAGRGLKGVRSGVFQHWHALLERAVLSGHAPRIVAFENVTGLMSRAGGQDFTYVLSSLMALGYRVGPLEIDARHFVPQSRPRLFVIALRKDIEAPDMTLAAPTGVFHTPKLQRYAAKAGTDLPEPLIWWRHGAPDPLSACVADLVDDAPDTHWLNETKVDALLAMMSDPSAARVAAARRSGQEELGLLYKRGRPDAQGTTRQRAEVRFDGLAGCLRTPAGGSSRQTILFIKGNSTRARLLSSLEVQRLMGLPESYQMPAHYNSAYKVAGDGVVVPVVQYLDDTLFQPMLRLAADRSKVA